MDENKIEGTARNLGGKAEEATGKLTGDAKTQAEGKADQFSGKAQKTYGDAKEAASDAADGAKEGAAKLSEKAGEGYDQAKAAVSDAAEGATGEIARLRAQVEELMRERVKPALNDAAHKASDYAHQARETIGEKAGQAGETIKERPLLSLAIIGVVGFVIGRLTSDRL
ncbi:MAG: CsbD family protein [Roseomonas mucosa]|nr:CsbD family protein [Roseomonas mucosa]